MTTSPASASVHRAVHLLIARVLLVGVSAVLCWLVLWLTTGTTGFPPAPLFAAVALLPANIVSLVLVRRMSHDEGRRVRDLIGFVPARVIRDLAWGVTWLAVLYLPFLATILGMMWLLHGTAMFTAFETVFFDSTAVPSITPGISLALGAVAVLTFAPLNAPVEELVYRGHAQQGLAAGWPVPLAITVSALAFGAQHAFFAPTSQAMLVYVAAFFVWGLGSGLIVHRQRRLLPIIVAHFIVNLFSSAPALVFAVVAI